MKHKIICGHVIPTLKSLPNEHVDMLMTSVPYWGLRDYGADTATIWGGDKGCKQEWENIPFGGRNKRAGDEDPKFSNGLKNPQGNSKLCSKCGAWFGQLGLEETPELYIEHLHMVFTEVKRVLKKTGTCWVNIGDSYSNRGECDPSRWKSKEVAYRHACNCKSLPPKCMVMIPERFAFMMLDLGYILRNKIIWHKPNPMPSSVKDRFNTTYEMLYFFSKSKKYWFDLDAVREEHKASSIQRNNYQWNSQQRTHSPDEKRGEDNREAGKLFQTSGKNPGDFWSINTQPFPEAHFAVFPEKLCEKPILAGCPAEVCKHCGTARVRITEKEGEPIYDEEGKPEGIKRSKMKWNNSHPSHNPRWWNTNKTIGWTDCPCSEENKYEPGIIIDPFGGSGTVGIVAEKLGRSSILIDIKKDYCEMAFKRLKALTEQATLTGERSEIEKVGF